MSWELSSPTLSQFLSWLKFSLPSPYFMRKEKKNLLSHEQFSSLLWDSAYLVLYRIAYFKKVSQGNFPTRLFCHQVDCSHHPPKEPFSSFHHNALSYSSWMILEKGTTWGEVDTDSLSVPWSGFRMLCEIPENMSKILQECELSCVRVHELIRFLNTAYDTKKD